MITPRRWSNSGSRRIPTSTRSARTPKPRAGWPPPRTRSAIGSISCRILRETIERELALHRAYLRVRVTPDGLPADPLPTPVLEPPVCPPVARERQLLPARRLAIQTEIGRQLRQSDQHLFDTFKALQATGRPIAASGQPLGC